MTLAKIAILSVLTITIGAPLFAYASSCDLKSKIVGFSTIKVTSADKAYFYKEPRLCGSTTDCDWKRKAYLLKDNFVQVAQTEGGFACSVFRDFEGNEGKETFGWLRVDDLAPIRAKLERTDLAGDWVQMGCKAGDDCEINISENVKEVIIRSHINDHPGFSIRVESLKESPGKLNISGTDAPKRKMIELQVTYDSDSLEPGTIALTGSKLFDGVYRR